MIEWLKKHFIPHAGNNHRPHMLHAHSTRAVILFLMLLELVAFIAPNMANLRPSNGMAAVLAAVLNDLTNERRREERLPALTVSPLLTLAAQMKADDMAAKGYFAHTSPEGKTPWYWIEQAGYHYQYAGENLAMNFRDSKDVTNAWLNSPSHKANIVKGNYTEIGTGIARGSYKGRTTLFVTQVYANPLPETEARQVPIIVSRESAFQPGTSVLGAEAEARIAERPAIWHKLAAAPRNTMDIIIAILFGVIAMTLLLYTAMRIGAHDKDLITNGLVMLAMLGAIMAANYYISYRGMIVTDSYDYALEDAKQ